MRSRDFVRDRRLVAEAKTSSKAMDKSLHRQHGYTTKTIDNAVQRARVKLRAAA